MRTLLDAFVRILDESSGLMLFGFLAAGLLHVLLEEREHLLAPLTRPGKRSVLLATLIGMPLPLCSCSVLPTALALQKRGAGKGATASFLVTVPETDAVSVLLTWSLLGPVMAVYRPLSSLLTGILAGFAVDAADRKRAEPAPAAAPAPACCCSCGDGESAPADAAAPAARPAWWRRALRYGFVDFFDDLTVRLLAGLLVGAAVAVFLPELHWEGLAGRHLLTYLVMLGIGVPMYVCATSSTPVAAGLVAAGVSPGAALVFLLVGPATNAASMLVLSRQFGRRPFAAYLGVIVAASLGLGLLLDVLLAGTDLSVAGLTGAAHAHGGGWHRAGTVVFLALSLWSLLRTRALQRGLARLRGLFAPASS